MNLPRTQTSPCLFMKMCAQPSVPFPWSLAVHHQSLAFRARLYDEKTKRLRRRMWMNSLICMQLNASVFPLIAFIISTCGN